VKTRYYEIRELQPFNRVVLSDGELASAVAALEILKGMHGDDGLKPILYKMADATLAAYDTAKDGTRRALLAKRARAIAIMRILSTGGPAFAADEDLFRDDVMLIGCEFPDPETPEPVTTLSTAHLPAGSPDGTGGQFTGPGGASGKHPIRHLYDRAGDVSIPHEHVQATLAALDEMSKAELLKLADEMELAGMKNKTATHIRKQIEMKVLDRRSGAQRQAMIEDHGEQADRTNARVQAAEGGPPIHLSTAGDSITVGEYRNKAERRRDRANAMLPPHLRIPDPPAEFSVPEINGMPVSPAAPNLAIMPPAVARRKGCTCHATDGNTVVCSCPVADTLADHLL
jgi:hypothetical protein